MAFLTGATCASDTVDIILRMCWNVEVKHMADRTDIDTAGGNIGTDEDLDFAVLELVEGFHAMALAHVAMQCTSVEPMFDK